MKAAIASLLLLLPACFVSRERFNEPVSPTAVARLEPGVSTADDVLLALGAPSDVVQLGRRSAWLYDFRQSKRAGLFLLVVTMVNTDMRSDRVWVFFDEEDTLWHVGGTYEAQDAEYALPWNGVD